MGHKIKPPYLIGACLCLLFMAGTVSADQEYLANDELKRAYELLFPSKSNKKLPRKQREVLPEKESTRRHAIFIAKKQIRKKYRWGGASPQTGFDCSGLTQYVFKTARVDIPRTAREQYKHTKRVPLAKLQAGDLIFFHTRRTRVKVNHVGLYLGKGKFIHAPRRGKTVSVENLNKYWKRKAIGAGRV